MFLFQSPNYNNNNIKAYKRSKPLKQSTINRFLEFIKFCQ